MKTIKILGNLRNMTLFLGILFSISVLLQSCKKNNNSNIEPALATISVVNAGAPSIDFYLESSKVNQSPLLYSQNTGYFQVIAGTRAVTLIKGGSVNTDDILAAGYVLLENGKDYSLFISRQSASSPDSIIGLIIKDDLTPPASGMAKIRFANYTPNSPAIDIIVKGGAALFTNKAFTTISEFITIDPAATYALEIHETGSSNVKFEIPAFNVEANKIYTVYVNGLWTGSAGNDVFGAHVITNR